MNRILQNLSTLSTSIIKLTILLQKKKSLQHPWADIFNKKGLWLAATQEVRGSMTGDPSVPTGHAPLHSMPTPECPHPS